eukprot:COSAG01_NODE_55261_length_326_cov_0.911894_1_plen_23_part_10
MGRGNTKFQAFRKKPANSHMRWH